MERVYGGMEAHYEFNELSKDFGKYVNAFYAHSVEKLNQS